jgi:hypothetical protein
VKFLLEQDDVVADSMKKNGGTPLLMAAMIAKLLRLQHS